MRVHVSVHVGSLVDPALGAHAIVNASNPHVGLGSGVSGAIREACGGHSFQEEVRGAWEAEFDKPLQPGDCLVTSAGTATAFRWVLHVPAVDYKVRDPETGGSSGPTRVMACAASALGEALTLALEIGADASAPFVLGMPLLGAGHGGLGEVASIRAITQALASVDTDTALSGILDVRFAVLEERIAALVRSAVEAC